MIPPLHFPMSIKFITTALLAAGLAVSKPIVAPHTVQALRSRQDTSAGIDTCANGGTGMIAALAALESRAQREGVKINAENLIIVDVDVNNNGNNRDRNNDRERDRQNGNGQDRGREDAEAARDAEQDAALQQLMLQQVNQALLADQQANAAKNEMDNVLRAVAATHNEPEKSTVLLVVQEVKINIEAEVQIDDNKRERRRIDASVFKQEAIVANRGKQETKTVMDVVAAAPGTAPTEAANATQPIGADATQTGDAILYNTKPTYTAIAEDPAALMRAALETALEDRQNDDKRAEEVKLNVQIAVEVKLEIEVNDGRGNDRNNDRDRNDRQKKEQEQNQREQNQDEQDRKEVEKQQQDQEREKAKQQDQQKQDKAEKDVQQKEQKQAQAEAEQKATTEQSKTQRDSQ